MREVVFDTETTGLNAASGDRLVEIGCVELVNRVETGRTYHAYFNPERSMPPEAQAVHGLSEAFLADKPLFGDLVEDLLDIYPRKVCFFPGSGKVMVRKLKQSVDDSILTREREYQSSLKARLQRAPVSADIDLF